MLTSGWAIASWFARPNALLDGFRPVNLMESDLASVLEAARCHTPVAQERQREPAHA